MRHSARELRSSTRSSANIVIDKVNDRPGHRRRARRALPRDGHLVPRSAGRHPLPRQDHPGDVRGAARRSGQGAAVRRGLLLLPAHRRHPDRWSRRWRSRRTGRPAPRCPQYVFDVLRAMPRDTHPMTMFSAAIARDAARVDVRQAATRRDDEEERTCGSRCTRTRWTCSRGCRMIAAYIYRMKYKGDTHIAAEPEARLGRQLRPHDGHREAVRRRGAHVLHPPLGSRVGERLGPHDAPRRFGALRRVLRRSRPASTASRARCTASRTRRCSAGSRTR